MKRKPDIIATFMIPMAYQDELCKAGHHDELATAIQNIRVKHALLLEEAGDIIAPFTVRAFAQLDIRAHGDGYDWILRFYTDTFGDDALPVGDKQQLELFEEVFARKPAPFAFEVDTRWRTKEIRFMGKTYRVDDGRDMTFVSQPWAIPFGAETPAAVPIRQVTFKLLKFGHRWLHKPNDNRFGEKLGQHCAQALDQVTRDGWEMIHTPPTD